ncbi:Ig-like domain-containing protein [Fictibacillus sp. FJAT-27399]|uniref:Ig-like domain-containing protein n=1 Tax=Fictibacillus sp. FJAT-27399 TaxID=1729689 RepID=UPI0009E85E12|nr:Ig-like domain-containing protein [Fictibacillus sp. FJAT-27399]
MKSLLLKAGMAGCLAIGLWPANDAHAAETTDIQAKCTSFGTLKKGTNPSFQHMNCLLTNAALQAGIPPEIVKAVASKENNGWKQFDKKGQPVISHDNGIGIMQITVPKNYDPVKLEMLKYSIPYNIAFGVNLLASKYKNSELPAVLPKDKSVLESWYFAIMAYNGIKPINSPVVQKTGKPNTNAYQEKVMSLLNADSFLGDTNLQKPAFSTNDFQYDPTKSDNIKFIKKSYSITKRLHASRYLMKKNDKAITSWDDPSFTHVKIRKAPTTESSSKYIKKNTPLTITDTFKYDQTPKSINQFVWFPVTVPGEKGTWYISSAYITKAMSKPSVNPVDDNDTSLSGKAPKGMKVTVKKGSKTIISKNADSKGVFNLVIPKQKAGTILSVTYQDSLNAVSPAFSVKVADKTAPSAPKVSAITSKTTTVGGSAEAYSTVLVKKGKTTLGKNVADKYGKYKVKMKAQRAGTILSVTATDKAKNTSNATTYKVKK